SDTVQPVDDATWITAPASPSSAPQTHLNQLLQQIADQHRQGEINAAIVLTDAVPNQPGGEPLKVPSTLADFPLFLVPTGTDYQFSDTTLWQATAPDTVVENDFMSVDCLVGATGFSGKTTRLVLKKEGRELDSAEVVFDENGGDQKIRLSTQVKASGTHQFDVVLEPLPGEVMADNNRESLEVKVVTGNLNVLLVDGWPRWETRYLGNLLKRDAGITHRELLVGTAPQTQWSGEVLSSSQKLGAHQVVVLGEVGPEFIGPTEMAALETYVNEGGNLIVMAGSEMMPAAFQKTGLADLLPIHLDQRRPGGSGGSYLAPTGVGRGIAALNLEDSRTKNDAVWRLGSSRLLQDDISPFNIPKPGAQTIVEALPINGPGDAALPYIVWHRYGAGRVFYFSSPTTYYLRYRFGDRYHYRFWGQFFRWVTIAEINRSGALISISTDQKRYQENDHPKVDVEIQNPTGEPITGATIKIRLSQKGGATTEHRCAELSGKAGVYQATIPALAPGEYQIETTGPELEKLEAEIARAQRPGNSNAAFVSRQISFFVEALPNLEDGDRTCDWETARKLVESTRGALLAPEALTSAIEILAQNPVKTAREEVTRIPLWDRWPVFFLILFFLAAEWAGRKYAGLL
ncbi:MAG: carboxypeptidase-like regulatory domain-containing protein, partial [Verrucomicrobiales bacterium]